MFRTLVFAAAIAMVLGTSTEAWAAEAGSRTNFSNSSPVGQGISGRSGLGSMGSMGTGGLGSSSSSGMLQLGSAAQQMMQRANQSGYFVGGSTQNTMSSAYGTATTGRTNYGTSSYGQGTYGSSAYGNRNRSNRAGQYGQYGQYGRSNMASESLVPTRLVLGFDRPAVSAPEFSSKLTARLEKVSRIQFRTAPQVLVENGTAILRGSVATEHDRVLAEQLVRLEAGISGVKNELTLPSAPASPSAPEKPSSAARPPQVPQSAPAAK